MRVSRMYHTLTRITDEAVGRMHCSVCGLTHPRTEVYWAQCPKKNARGDDPGLLKPQSGRNAATQRGAVIQP